MKFKILFFGVLFFCSNLILAQDLKPEQQKFIKSFIENVKNSKKEAIAAMVVYPLKREYPIPGIKSKAEFVKRYTEIFDADLINEISKSDPAKDWSLMGWRGIMLNQGTIWMTEEGELFAVNYQSKFEANLSTKIITAIKGKLHASIANFETPVCILETSKFRVRIDDLGNDNYRYASWPLKKAMSEEPDLVITNGKWFQDGTGGNHHFDFKKGQYLYECYIAPLREKGASPASLTIYNNEKKILFQEAKIVSE
ncbi:hypothetical protein SGQ44_02185 [Flavobacterium sp. Fl-77]|uniref:Uncharacterized protein n=1 Tax=Flavobacterium flavipigmentatum TaxID=2893884 RepID=A0AAJ2S4W3_9FLAO|nr:MULTISPECIES: hypothetical protein [unclassified Flavobacterium]MDX6180947.1 hypothetical protein [Flavobacterium sp. Fl-33]MDX6184548.1 hypothetical protein [Flavobacterium sp. Fl-77]UFH39653.1 hypothetical protein LNP22_05080 [Flavobacterium sp. F-70]